MNRITFFCNYGVLPPEIRATPEIKIVVSPNVNEYFRKPFKNLIESHNIDPAIAYHSAI